MVGRWFLKAELVPGCIPLKRHPLQHLYLQPLNSPLNVRREKKKSQDFHLTSQINTILYWVLAMRLSTLLDLELFIMLLQQVVEKNKSILLTKRSRLFQVVIWAEREKSISSLMWHLHTQKSQKKPLVTEPCAREKLCWQNFLVCL